MLMNYKIGNLRNYLYLCSLKIYILHAENMTNSEEQLDFLFETSWEVCNKVGGIYAVLSTKAKTLQKLYKDKVVFIGPDLWSDENPSPYFKESKTLLKKWRQSAVLPDGMTVRVGRWDVPGKPIVILVGYNSLYSYKDQLYIEMWNRFGVDSLHAYGDYDESCIFAYAAALVIESIYLNEDLENKKVVAHFDEWTTGMGLLYVKAHLPHIATVFTTHATSIGRSICGNGKPLYDYMSGYNGDQMAAELNMQSKHSLEKAAAWNTDSFTTVSDVTARECEQLLCRRPLVTPNGFEQNFVPSKKEYVSKRNAARERMLTVAGALTGNKFADDTILIATSGRNEFRNKGLDAFIDSMNVLRTKWDNTKRKIVCFIMVPAWVDVPRTDLIAEMKKSRWTGLENANITHTLHNYSQDSVYGKLNYLGIHNAKGENLVIIYVPSYLNGNDGIFDMPYYDLLPGLDCTVFASYYEPWGYTPLESIAFGVPTVTTDLAGFGQWILEDAANSFEKSGVMVVHRSDSNYSEAVNEIAGNVYALFVGGSDGEAKAREAAMATSKLASWQNFIGRYIMAYSEALKNVRKCGE